jgi:hypothetical protein
LQVIATSTEALGLHGEVLVRVAPMQLPASPDPADVMRSASGRLFVERAAAARADFALSEDNARGVFDVCDVVAGVPLAIELAAGLCDVIAADELAAQLGDGSIAAVSGASVAQLAPHEQRALAALTLPASPMPKRLADVAVASSGSDDVDGVLAHLVRRGLLRHDPDERYSIPAPIRARLDAAPESVVAVLEALLDACLEQTSGDAGTLTRYEPFAATSAMLLERGELAADKRQRLAVQLTPWWVGRLGTGRAREHLTAALQLGDTGPGAAALHMAIADTYPPGQETLDTEWHLQRAAVLLGEHDTVDAQLVARLQDATRRASRDERS